MMLLAQIFLIMAMGTLACLALLSVVAVIETLVIDSRKRRAVAKGIE
jgi:hypothetical protein